MKSRRLIWALVVALLCLVAQLVFLARLDYSTGLLQRVSLREASEDPSTRFRVGTLRWDIAAYLSAPSLEPLRSFYESSCPGTRGSEAALAITQSLAAASPFGDQKREFLAPHFDPAAELAAMRAGSSSHCVNRSAVVAATLLSVGIPARVVQLVPEDSKGHNVVEVWDEPGWVLVDPSTGGLIADARGPCSAAEAVLSPERINLVPRVRSAMDNPDEMYRTRGSSFFRGQIVYPEPWLYTRVGRKAAPWPFRGSFAVAGSFNWKYGPAQTALHWGILTCLLALIALPLFASRLRGAHRRLVRAAEVLRRESRDATPGPAPAGR